MGRLPAHLCSSHGHVNREDASVLAATWGVPAKHGDIPNAYVEAEKDSHLEILLQIPQAIDVNEAVEEAWCGK